MTVCADTLGYACTAASETYPRGEKSILFLTPGPDIPHERSGIFKPIPTEQRCDKAKEKCRFIQGMCIAAAAA
jgi:hypothetical protein